MQAMGFRSDAINVCIQVEPLRKESILRRKSIAYARAMTEAHDPKLLDQF